MRGVAASGSGRCSPYKMGPHIDYMGRNFKKAQLQFGPLSDFGLEVSQIGPRWIASCGLVWEEKAHEKASCTWAIRWVVAGVVDPKLGVEMRAAAGGRGFLLHPRPPWRAPATPPCPPPPATATALARRLHHRRLPEGWSSLDASGTVVFAVPAVRPQGVRRNARLRFRAVLVAWVARIGTCCISGSADPLRCVAEDLVLSTFLFMGDCVWFPVTCFPPNQSDLFLLATVSMRRRGCLNSCVALVPALPWALTALWGAGVFNEMPRASWSSQSEYACKRQNLCVAAIIFFSPTLSILVEGNYGGLTLTWTFIDHENGLTQAIEHRIKEGRERETQYVFWNSIMNLLYSFT